MSYKYLTLRHTEFTIRHMLFTIKPMACGTPLRPISYFKNNRLQGDYQLDPSLYMEWFMVW